MAQKNATPTKEQAAVMKRHKLSPVCWVVTKEHEKALVVMHRITREFRCIAK